MVGHAPRPLGQSTSRAVLYPEQPKTPHPFGPSSSVADYLQPFRLDRLKPDPAEKEPEKVGRSPPRLKNPIFLPTLYRPRWIYFDLSIKEGWVTGAIRILTGVRLLVNGG